MTDRKAFKIEGYDEVFEIADQSRRATVYGAIAMRDGKRVHSFFVTPFDDQVEELL